MMFLPFRALAVFLGSIITGAIVAWQVEIWLGLLVIFIGVLASMYLAVKDALKELKDTVSLAKNPGQILVASGLVTRKIPFWLKPVAIFIFNKLLDSKNRKKPASKKQVKSRPYNNKTDNLPTRGIEDKSNSYQQ